MLFPAYREYNINLKYRLLRFQLMTDSWDTFYSTFLFLGSYFWSTAAVLSAEQVQSTFFANSWNTRQVRKCKVIWEPQREGI